MPPDPILQRIAAADWTDAPESTVASQLIMPVLMLLGYGQHTLHEVVEQKTYKLSDPTYSKGSRRVRLDYQPRVYEEGLWVMEAKGTDTEVSSETLGQVRDYAIHPEVRAALMVTVDRGGFRIFDPWDEHWDTALLSVALDEVPSRIEELRAVLGVDRVADFVRRRHLDHLRRTLSASLEFGVLLDAEREFRDLLQDARTSINTKRMAVHKKAREEAEALHDRVLVNSGAWGVAQHHNSAWADSRIAMRDLERAVLAHEERQRPTQMMQVRRAIEAVFAKRCPEGAPLYRPLWWLHIVILAGFIGLRGKPGCEPYAEEMARQAIRDALLGFPDDEVAAASWRLQRIFIPLRAREISQQPLDEFSAGIKSGMSAEDKIRWRLDPTWFLMQGVTLDAIGKLGSIEPWSVLTIEREITDAQAKFDRLPSVDGEWVGPVGDPWLKSWGDVDHLQMIGIAVLQEDPRGDDLVDEDDVRSVILKAARSDHQVVSRVAGPLADRLGLR